MSDDRSAFHATNADRERLEDSEISPEGTEPDSLVQNLEQQLHQLDRDLERLKQRIWQTRNGMIPCDDPVAEADRLQAQFDERGNDFTKIYQAWSQANEQD